MYLFIVAIALLHYSAIYCPRKRMDLRWIKMYICCHS